MSEKLLCTVMCEVRVSIILISKMICVRNTRCGKYYCIVCCVSEVHDDRNINVYFDVSEVQNERNFTVYSDVCRKYRAKYVCVHLCVSELLSEGNYIL